MKYLLPLAIALVFTACNDAKKTDEAATTAPVEMNSTETTSTTTSPEANMTTETTVETNTTTEAPAAN